MSARLAAVALVLALAACATGPAYPLLTPLGTAKDFGYAETPQGADRYSITYVTPTALSSAFGGAPRDPDAVAARTLGYDMATWRAAQLAAAGGYAGFQVADREADVTFYPDPLDVDFPSSFWGPGWWRARQPLWQESGPWLPPRLLISAHVTIAVRLLHAPGEDDLVAADTIARLATTYPDAAAK